MPPSFGDLEDELTEISVEVEHLATRLRKFVPGLVLGDPQERWEAAHICASATEKVYTGCERVMAWLASEIDGAPIAKSDAWHSTLLHRMANPMPPARDAILSAECYALLDRLRSFRHRERNSYGINLDLEIVLDRAAEAVTAFHIFRFDIETFLTKSGARP